MIKRYLLSILLGLTSILSISGHEKDGVGFKEIKVIDGITIQIPLIEKFDQNHTYKHIQIWLSDKKVFEDTSETEYLFDDNDWPKVIKISNVKYLVYLKVFDAPDLNKLYKYEISHSQTLLTEILPFFYNGPLKISGHIEYSGILSIVETPCENCDSCYYNPRLFYKITNRGFLLDSVVTIMMNKKQWNGFYGYSQRTDIILPCK